LACEQPFADSLFWTTTWLANLVQQGGCMNGVAEPSGQRWTVESLNRFHGGTITWPGKVWRISFSPQNAHSAIPNLNEVEPQSPRLPDAGLPWENHPKPPSTSTRLWQNFSLPNALAGIMHLKPQLNAAKRS